MGSVNALSSVQPPNLWKWEQSFAVDESSDLIDNAGQNTELLLYIW